LTDCPYFVAVKVSPVDTAAPTLTHLALPILIAYPQFAAEIYSRVENQHDLYLSVRVLRI
jgi:hypothetical protein